MDVCPRVSVLCCPVSVEALRRADPPSKESYQMSLYVDRKAHEGRPKVRERLCLFFFFLKKLCMRGSQLERTVIVDSELDSSWYMERLSAWNKVKLSLCLSKYHGMKTYWGVEV
jgi:hypothetical protein